MTQIRFKKNPCRSELPKSFKCSSQLGGRHSTKKIYHTVNALKSKDTVRQLMTTSLKNSVQFSRKKGLGISHLTHKGFCMGGFCPGGGFWHGGFCPRVYVLISQKSDKLTALPGKSW